MPTSTGSSRPRASRRPWPGLHPNQIDALYFTGGSTGFRLLASRIGAAFPAARAVRGDRFAECRDRLGLFAQRRFGLAA